MPKIETPEERTRRLNDEMRSQLATSVFLEPYGRLMLSRGVAERDHAFVAQAVHAISRFDDFTDANDPHGEHDFGAFEIDGERLFWKLDYLDPTLTCHSEDKSNREITVRVITIFFAEEY